MSIRYVYNPRTWRFDAVGQWPYVRQWIFDYNDSATAWTPISITGWGWYVNLTNDELWPFTNKDFKPEDIADIWDATTNAFDFTGLKLGETIEIRLDISVTTTTPNTALDIDLIVADGEVWEYALPFVTAQAYKSAWTYKVTKFNGVYMWDDNTRLNSARFKAKADENCSIVVNGWYVKVNQNKN